MTNDDPNLKSQISNLKSQTRRHFFGQCGVGVGAIALNQLLQQDGVAAPTPSVKYDPANPLAPRPGHFAPKVKNVIYLFMAGAPSQLELFDDKPKLRELHGQPPPKSLLEGKRFAFLKGNETLMGSKRKFEAVGACGLPLSEMCPHHRKFAHEVCWLQGLRADVFNHGPAKLFMNTGFQPPMAGRPGAGKPVFMNTGFPAPGRPAMDA